LEALPEHQREMALFALATGLRQSNVTGLCWSQVYLKRHTAWIASERQKAAKTSNFVVRPGTGGYRSGSVGSILCVSSVRRQTGQVREYESLAECTQARRSGRFPLARLRHTWASWLIQNGTPLYDLKEMGG
jgi:integrase